MANIRQYIGARYVIKIYENSLDSSSAEWEQGNYEPLVMVTWQNGSYLSKKEVPGTVGNPANNPDYWVQTGFYNGQIAALQQQVNTINSNIGNIADLNTSATDLVSAINEVLSAITTETSERYIIITDSYGGYRDSDSNRLVDLIGDAVNAAADDRFVYGGVGFTNANGVGTFLSALQAETISDPEKVTDIIVIGGQNDYGRVAADISAGIEAFITYCKTTFPNALVSIANATKSRCLSAVNPDVVMISGVISSYYACLAYRGCVNYGARYLKGTEYIMHNAALYESITSPHPNASGVKTLANKIIEAIKTGSCSVYYSGDYDLTAVSGTGYTVTVPSAGFLWANVIDGVTQLNVNVPARRFTITFDTPTHMIDGAFTIANPSDQTLLLALGQSGIPWGLSLAVEAYCYDENNTFLHTIPGWVHVGDNGELICTLQRGITPNSNSIKSADIVVTQTVASYQSILC